MTLKLEPRKKNKRRISSSDNYDYDDPFIDDSEFEVEKTVNSKKLNELKRNIINKTLNMNKIFEMDFGEENNIWFFENLEILKRMEEYTEEWQALKNKIYNKYISLKYCNSNFTGEDNIFEKIKNSKFDEGTKQILYSKYISCMNSSSAYSDESLKLVNWINTVLEIPVENNKISIDDNIENTLIKI